MIKTKDYYIGSLYCDIKKYKEIYTHIYGFISLYEFEYYGIKLEYEKWIDFPQNTEFDFVRQSFGGNIIEYKNGFHIYINDCVYGLTPCIITNIHTQGRECCLDNYPDNEKNHKSMLVGEKIYIYAPK